MFWKATYARSALVSSGCRSCSYIDLWQSDFGCGVVLLWPNVDNKQLRFVCTQYTTSVLTWTSQSTDTRKLEYEPVNTTNGAHTVPETLIATVTGSSVNSLARFPSWHGWSLGMHREIAKWERFWSKWQTYEITRLNVKKKQHSISSLVVKTVDGGCRS